jgi:sugar phosphate isomerase/epimerase
MPSPVTRRTALAALGAAGFLAGNANSAPQAAAERNGGPKAGIEQGPRTTPMVCAFSQNLARVPYAELGNVASQIGYDGVDLTVMDGGHVDPHITNVDLVRAIESVRGAALEVPMITTTLTSASDPTAYPILAITGRTQVHLYRTGFWPWGFMPDLARRTAEIRSDLMNLMAIGKQYQMTAMIPNRAGGYFGEALWDANTVISTLDSNLIGYYFDPSQTQGWETALTLVRPRLKAVAVQDYYWEKSGKTWARKMCPMGEGAIDWALFFRMLAQFRYTGPISVHFEYPEKDGLGAMTKDLEFVRTQIKTAFV